jgi:hypothetical protein
MRSAPECREVAEGEVASSFWSLFRFGWGIARRQERECVVPNVSPDRRISFDFSRQKPGAMPFRSRNRMRKKTDFVNDSILLGSSRPERPNFSLYENQKSC